jgi:hypothetical protein
MTKTAQKKGLQMKSQTEAKVLAEELEVTGRIEDGFLTIQIPINTYKNDRGSTMLGSSFGRFVKVAGAVSSDKDVILSFTAVQSDR